MLLLLILQPLAVRAPLFAVAVCSADAHSLAIEASHFFRCPLLRTESEDAAMDQVALDLGEAQLAIGVAVMLAPFDARVGC